MRMPLTLLCLASFTLHADDWPQWLGPQRDAVWRETGIVETFPAGGPQTLWRSKIGGGYAGPAVADGKVYVMDREVADRTSVPANAFARGIIPGSERVLCLDAKTGRQVWEHRYDCTYTMSYSTGPRATPLVHEGKVWTFGAEAHLHCLDATTGKVLWAHDLKQEYNAKTPQWGFAGQLLLDGSRLVCLCGGPGSVVVALDKDSGKELWRALDAREPGYGVPTLIEAGGTRQLLIWHPQSVNSLDPATGKVFWSYPWEVRFGLTIPTPRVAGDRLFLTSFYTSSKCFKLDAGTPAAELLWEGKSISEKNTDTLHSIMSTPFIEDGHIYGVCSYGQLRCLKLETGERIWETFAATTGGGEVRWANAFIVKHENRFFLANEQGDLIIAKMTPKGYEELSRAHVLKPTTTDPRREVVWSHPAFANQCVFMRNDEEIVCVSLAK
ncbi:MAG: PQQ-like beta-propeller repeat protein [Prosthecobacter sp.]|jgi:outer membrane protein assembly factor BamB|nr:PQQ-like beta-propeller repeat protein [Prosthecobacter sp.]